MFINLGEMNKKYPKAIKYFFKYNISKSIMLLSILKKYYNVFEYFFISFTACYIVFSKWTVSVVICVHIWWYTSIIYLHCHFKKKLLIFIRYPRNLNLK